MTSKVSFCEKISSDFRNYFKYQDYSMFKHGSKSTARWIGTCMGDQLFEDIKDYIRNGEIKSIVFLPSPYFNIPTATYALKDYMIGEFSKLCIDEGFNIEIHQSKIHRKPNYVTDYSAMSELDRMKHIGDEKFHTDVEFLKGKFIVFVDDVKITGSHQKMIEEMIVRLGIESIHIFSYYAVADSSLNPNVEDFLNMNAIKDLTTINDMIRSHDFILNTRNTKYILSRDTTDFQEFIKFQSSVFRRTLYNNIISNLYHTFDEFRQNFQTLKNLI